MSQAKMRVISAGLARRDARKRACPVWGALGGNRPLRGDKAPSFDSMFVGKKHEPRWLWHAMDHRTGKVLTYVFGRRKDAVFLKLQALLQPCGMTRYSTDDWGAYTRHIDPAAHQPGKRNTPRIERKRLTLRIRIKRLTRKTLCFSTSIQMPDIVIGLFVNRYEFGVAL